MVFGFLRDDSAEKDKRRADEATAENVKLRQQNTEAQQLILQAQQQAELGRLNAEQERERAERERERAEQAEAELLRVRAEYDQDIVVRLRRLEAVAGIAPPDPDDARPR